MQTGSEYMKKINSLPKKEIKTVFMQGNKYLNTLSPLHNIYAETWLSLRSYSNSSVCLQHAFCQGNDKQVRLSGSV